MTFLRLYVFRTSWHTSAICVVYSNLKDSIPPKNGIKSWTFSCNYFLQLSTWINSITVASLNSIQFLAIMLHQEPVFLNGTVNSTKVVIYSKTNLVKVVQNRKLLFRQPLMLCANWYCKALGISGTSIHSILNEHLTVKKFICVGSHTICQSLRKRLVSIDRKKCSKNTIAVLWNTSMTSWQVMNRGFTRKQQSTVWVFQDEPNPIKVARPRSTSKQMIACFCRKTGHVTIAPHLSYKKSGKPTSEDGSLFTTTTRVPTHRLKQLHFWTL